MLNTRADPSDSVRSEDRREYRALRISIAILCIAAAVAFNQSAVHWRNDLTDQHLFGYYGWRIAQGARPYLDVWDNKPPGIWWANAAASRIFGDSIAADIALGALALSATLVSFLGMARAAFHPTLALPALIFGGVVLTHLRFECGGDRTETFVAAAEAIAVFAYLRGTEGGGWRWLALAGFAAGAAPLFKQAGIAAAAACAADFVLFRLRSGQELTGTIRAALAFLGAYAILPLVAAAALASQGALSEALFATITFNRAYFAVNDASWTNLPAALVVLWPALQPLLGLFLLAVCGVVLAFVRTIGKRCRVPGRLRGPTLLFSIWALLALYMAAVGPGRREYHLMPALTPLALLALTGLDHATRQAGLFASVVARPSLCVAVLAYGVVLVGLARDSASVATRGWALKPHWYAITRSEPAAWELQAEAIRALTRPDESIYVWGWSPGTYRAACRSCASRFATTEKMGQVGSHAEFILAGAIADIQRVAPRLIALPPRDWMRVQTYPCDAYEKWFASKYQSAALVAGMQLVVRSVSR